MLELIKSDSFRQIFKQTKFKCILNFYSQTIKAKTQLGIFNYNCLARHINFVCFGLANMVSTICFKTTPPPKKNLTNFVCLAKIR